MDGGQSWTATNAGLPLSWIQALRIDPGNSSIVYAGTRGFGVFKSINGGLTWQPTESN